MKNDLENETETEMMEEVNNAIEEVESTLFLQQIIAVQLTNSDEKEKPCEEEMQLFSECLVNGENCEEFEEKYFKCMDSAN